MKNLVWKYSYKNHLSTKNIILNKINECNSDSISTEQDTINNSDYFTVNNHRDYLKILSEHLVDFHQKILDYYCCSRFSFGNGWFQQYIVNDIHDWHFHAKANLSIVYFLELNDSSESTEFFDIIKKESFQVDDVKEGDLIIFPGFLPHRSPLKKSNSRKTIISYNINLENTNIDLLPGRS